MKCLLCLRVFLSASYAILPESSLKNGGITLLVLIKNKNNLRGKYLISTAGDIAKIHYKIYLNPEPIFLTPHSTHPLVGHHGIISKEDTTIVRSGNKCEIKQTWKYSVYANFFRKNVIYIPEKGVHFIFMKPKAIFCCVIINCIEQSADVRLMN